MRAVIYLRISLDRHGDGLAVERQEEDCVKLIQARGWDLVETYVDNSISASDSTKVRPAYNRMIQDWQAGRFDVLVCWDLDRLTRQPRQLEDWIDQAEKRGLRIVTANGEADLGTDAGRMFARIKAAVARSEVDRKSARQKRAAQQRAEQGKPWGPRRPFGFKEGMAELDPTEAAVVRWMYDEILAGVGQRELVRRLDARGIRTALGNKWSQPTLRQFLLNPRNAGLRAYKDEIIGPGAWPEIVSEATWRSTVARLQGRGGPAYSRARKYLLVGIARCGVCGTPVNTQYSPTGTRQYGCPQGHVTRGADNVDALVEKVLLAQLRRSPGLDLSGRDEATDHMAEAEALRARLTDLALEFADGGLTPAQLRAATERLQEKLQEVEARLASSAGNPTLAALAASQDVLSAWSNLDLDRRRAVVDAVLEIEIQRTRRGAGFRPEDVTIRARVSD